MQSERRYSRSEEVILVRRGLRVTSHHWTQLCLDLETGEVILYHVHSVDNAIHGSPSMRGHH